MKDYTTALNEWLKRAQNIVNEQSIAITKPILKISNKGIKYDKILSVSNQTFAFCFIDKSNGDVLKVASYNTPAKHARGNIFEIGKEGVNSYGAYYLK